MYEDSSCTSEILTIIFAMVTSAKFYEQHLKALTKYTCIFLDLLIIFLLSQYLTIQSNFLP